MKLWAIKQRNHRDGTILVHTIRFSRKDAWAAWENTHAPHGLYDPHKLRQQRQRDGTLRAVKVTICETA